MRMFLEYNNIRARKVVYKCFMALIVVHSHTRVCAKFHNSSLIFVREFTLMDVKILAFNNSNIYFIYFITFFYNTPKINSTGFFFTTSFKYSLNIIFYSHSLFSLFLSGSFASLKSEPRSTIQPPQPPHHNQATCHQQLHNSEKTFHYQMPTTRSHNKEKAYTKLGKKWAAGGVW